MKLYWKLVIFILLLFFFQFLIGKTNSFWKLDELKKNINQTDIFFYGSSVNWYTDKSDKDKRFISQVLDSLQKDNHVYGISDAAYNLEIFRDFLKYIVKNKKSKSKLMIFEINLRSFSPEWNDRPNYQFEKERFILKDDLISKFEKPLSIFKYDFKQITNKEFLNKSVYKGKQKVGYVKDYVSLICTDTTDFMKKKITFHYLYKLNQNHRKIKAINEIIKISKNYNLNVLFFITPIDYLTGVKYLPYDFKKITTENIEFIDNLLKKQNISLLDFSYSLSSKYFSYNKIPNEHLKYLGRYFIADEINKWCNKNLSK